MIERCRDAFPNRLIRGGSDSSIYEPPLVPITQVKRLPCSIEKYDKP